jgi:uncharacterized protein (DUF983 family)
MYDPPLPEPAEILCPSCEGDLFLTPDRLRRYCRNCDYIEPHQSTDSKDLTHA